MPHGRPRPLVDWLGLQDTHGVDADDRLPGTVMLGGLVLLLVLWLVNVEVVRRTRPTPGRLWGVAAAWAVPFVVGPPLMDTTVYDYAAFGLLQRHGLDPTITPPASSAAAPSSRPSTPALAAR